MATAELGLNAARATEFDAQATGEADEFATEFDIELDIDAELSGDFDEFDAGPVEHDSADLGDGESSATISVKRVG